MKTINTAILIVILALTAAAQDLASPRDAKLEDLRKAIETNPTNSDKLKYLKLFPRTCGSFRTTFYGSNLNELYPTYEQHLSLLQGLFDQYPKKVISIWLGVATYCSWEGDALGDLQHQLAKFGAKDTKTFAIVLLAKPKTERLSIIRFLADVENHRVYWDYQLIQKNLKQLGFHTLERAFTAAKNRQIKERDHAF
jgi:hypothetical protein